MPSCMNRILNFRHRRFRWWAVLPVSYPTALLEWQPLFRPRHLPYFSMRRPDSGICLLAAFPRSSGVRPHCGQHPRHRQHLHLSLLRRLKQQRRHSCFVHSPRYRRRWLHSHKNRRFDYSAQNRTNRRQYRPRLPRTRWSPKLVKFPTSGLIQMVPIPMSGQSQALLPHRLHACDDECVLNFRFLI